MKTFSNKTWIATSVLTLFLTMAGCGSSGSDSNPSSSSSSSSSSSTSSTLSSSSSSSTSSTGSVSSSVSSSSSSSASSVSVEAHKAFAFATDDYGSGAFGPVMLDVNKSSDGSASVSLTTVNGDNGDLFVRSGTSTWVGNALNFRLHLIMCSDTNWALDPDGTGATADFNLTVESSGIVSGTFLNTLVAGDTCEESGTQQYAGTISGDDVTGQSPADIHGSYTATVYPDGEASQTVDVDVGQNADQISLTITTPDSTVINGSGTVYGDYTVFSFIAIICSDSNSAGQAEYATFFGQYNGVDTVSGIYGDDIPDGDSCHDNSAVGSWKMVKK